jgi:hypothetical protein
MPKNRLSPRGASFSSRINGATTFTLPTDFKEELNPEISDYDSTGYRRMAKIIKNGIDKRDPSDSGRPLNYRIWEIKGAQK